jgi:hypothetical protein
MRWLRSAKTLIEKRFFGERRDQCRLTSSLMAPRNMADAKIFSSAGVGSKKSVTLGIKAG